MRKGARKKGLRGAVLVSVLLAGKSGLFEQLVETLQSTALLR